MYTLDLRPGTYELSFSDINGPHQDTTVSEVVTASTTTLGNVAMQPIENPTVSGRIFGLQRPTVGAREGQAGGAPRRARTGSTTPSRSTMRAGANGRYSFDDVPPNEYYTVRASGYMHAAGVLGGGTTHWWPIPSTWTPTSTRATCSWTTA